jgi:hypothetical protein
VNKLRILATDAAIGRARTRTRTNSSRGNGGGSGGSGGGGSGGSGGSGGGGGGGVGDDLSTSFSTVAKSMRSSVGSRYRFSASLLKSLLQKNIRLSRAQPAVRIAMHMIHKASFVEFLVRLAHLRMHAHTY